MQNISKQTNSPVADPEYTFCVPKVFTEATPAASLPTSLKTGGTRLEIWDFELPELMIPLNRVGDLMFLLDLSVPFLEKLIVSLKTKGKYLNL